jgi:hypothetical protein
LVVAGSSPRLGAGSSCIACRIIYENTIPAAKGQSAVLGLPDQGRKALSSPTGVLKAVLISDSGYGAVDPGLPTSHAGAASRLDTDYPFSIRNNVSGGAKSSMQTFCSGVPQALLFH